MKTLNLFGLLGLLFCSQLIFAQTPKELQEHWWHPFSGSIEEIHQYNNTLYYGGNFSYIGPNNRNGGILDLADDLNPLPFTARPNGLVDKVIADGAGGWFIAGNFTSIGTSPRQGVARINRNGSLHPWAPAFNGKVRELLLHQGVLYAGGEFNQIGTTLRNRVCAFDSLGNLLPWNPSSNGTVNVFKIFQDKLLVGGNFTNIGGVNRNRLAELDLQNGNAGPLSIVINGEIRALEVVGSRIYIGGDFNGVNGVSANVGKLACYDYVLGGFTSFKLNFDNNVYSLHFNSGFLYVGGIFTSINSQTKISAAAIDTTGVGLVTGVDFSLAVGSGVVNSITSINNVIYLGGIFSKGNDYGILAFSYQTGFLPSKTPKVTNFGSVMSMAVSGDRLYLGGNFTSIGGANNYGIAAIDMTTGRLKKGNISKILEGAIIRDFEAKDSLLYFSGNFTFPVNDGGLSRNVAAYNMKTDSFIDLNIEVSGTVLKVKLDSNILYLGGDFTVINTLPRLDFAAINLTTKSLEPLAVNANGNIEEIEISGDTLIVGGSFSSIGGISRSNLASFNKNTGTVHAWNPNVNNRVRTMALKDNLLYIAGDFTTVSTTSRSRIAAINRSTGVLSAWNPGANQQIFKIRVYDNLLYVVGSFTTIKSQSRSYAAAFNLINDSLIVLPTFNNSVYEVYVDPLLTCYGGFFSIVNNVSNNIGGFMNPCKAFISSVFRAPICTNDQVVLSAPLNRNAKYQWLSGSNTPLTDKKDYLLSITSPGTYKVVMQNDTFACADTSAAVSINYLEKSFATLSPNKDTMFCRNQPFILSVDSSALVTEINWYRNNLPLFTNRRIAPVGNTSGNYNFFAIVSNVNGCKDTSKVINVRIINNPSSSFPQGKSAICDADSVLLTIFSQPNLTYQWLLDGQIIPNKNDTFIYAKDKGAYAARLTTIEGCSSTTTSRNLTKGLSPVIVIADSSYVGFCSGSSLILFDKDSATNRMASYRWIMNGFNTSITKPFIVTVNEATFRLIGTNKEGCTDTSILVTTIAYPKPPPIYILGETNAILNSTYNYSVENTLGSVYRWAPINGTQVSVAQTANANMRWTVVGNAALAVVETNRFGCNGDTAKSDITVVIPSLSLNRTSLTLNSDFGEMGFVSVSSNANWTVTEGATWLSVDKTSGSGNEDVMFITDQPNNTGASRSTTAVFSAGSLTVNLLVTQSSSTGINELNNKLKISVYPNPSNGTFTIHNEENSELSFSILDIAGKEIGVPQTLKAKEEISFNTSLPVGVYLIQFNLNNSTFFKKIVVNK
ncbi:MAG: T9SS type A sorting domain-containing protein [Bacteroidetes bacterium]|nr:T9SS type A sorting domain-containing protein [Bacteroidota bacterium]